MTDKPEAQYLSKTEFMLGEECPLALWRSHNAPDVRDEPDDIARDLMEQGNEVQRFARHLHRDNTVEIMFDSMTHSEAAVQTDDAMGDPFVDVIYEATFLVDGHPFRVDMLRRDGQGGWEVVEIKAGTGVKAEYLKDVAFQVHALRKVTKISSAQLCLLDGEFSYKGDGIDPWELFRFENITAEVDELQEYIAKRAEELRAIKYSKVAPRPEVVHGDKRCKKEACRAMMPKKNGIPNHITDLMKLRAGTRKFNTLKEAGIELIDQIPPDFDPALSKYQEIHWRAMVTMEPWVDEEKIQELLGHLSQGFHNWDIEATQYAIPRYVNSSPFEQIPQQWSNTKMLPDGTIEWSDFIADGIEDPRRAFAESIIEEFANDNHSIIVYSDYEEQRIERLCVLFPDIAAELRAIKDRFVDLLKVVQQTCYYPEFKGRYSEKYVLPALVPGFDHKDLDIQNGIQASRWLRSLSNPDLNAEDRAAIVHNCRMYNKRDTDGTFALTIALSPDVREIVARRYPQLRRTGVTADSVRSIVDGTPALRRLAR